MSKTQKETDSPQERLKAVLGAALKAVAPQEGLAKNSGPLPSPTPEKEPAKQEHTEQTNTNPNLPYWYPKQITSATFDLLTYLNGIPHLEKLLKSPEGRRTITEADPLLFALIYLPHHMKDPNQPQAPPSFADCHFDWTRLALRWAANKNRTDPARPQEDRNAEIAPRNCGKSTWWFLILPMWAAAHGHKKFVAAFAATTTQAEGHLRTFKNELDTNKHLREDFPDLCSPQRRLRGAVVADRTDQFNAANGFVFVAKGVDSSNLGMKVDEVRPDLLLLDDVEPDERMYSAELARKRLGTIQDSILQLNIYASVVFVGTVTMPDSIIHQLVKAARGQELRDWISDEKVKPHYYAPIVQNPDGTTRSLWPEKWPLDYLISIQHTRSYAKNYANDPKGRDGDYWNDDDFTRETINKTPHTRTAMFLDPPTTSSKTSDPAGIAVVSWNPPTKSDQERAFEAAVAMAGMGADINRVASIAQLMTMPNTQTTRKNTATNKAQYVHPGTTSVLYADEVRKTGKALAKHVYKLIEQNPQWNVRLLVVEVTQGGDLWLEVFADSPVKVRVVNPRESKEARFDRALEYYQKRPTLVTHDPKANLAKLEEQQMGFPKHIHDDIADATVTGILYFLEPKKKKIKGKIKSRSYV